MGPDGPIRNAANAAFLGQLTATYYPRAEKGLSCWAELEARSMLGDGDQAYVVGSKYKPPLRPQHRGWLAEALQCLLGHRAYNLLAPPFVAITCMSCILGNLAK